MFNMYYTVTKFEPQKSKAYIINELFAFEYRLVSRFAKFDLKITLSITGAIRFIQWFVNQIKRSRISDPQNFIRTQAIEWPGGEWSCF